MRGLDKQLSCERLRVNLLVARRELVHVDTLDLYAARMRRMFLKEAAAELYVEEAALKQDLGRVLLELELRQDAADPPDALRSTSRKCRVMSGGAHGGARAAQGSAAAPAHPGRLRGLRPGGGRDEQAGLLPGLRLPPAAAAPCRC